ncbi:efflux RND transporter periplasmic adaptor subunit [Paenibacillus pasadenensis]|uniref:efflux RND transporter periplasmic adaptor subunit n=1 Tax=Paenibacillus pasadenensis TaxID=217090 RepID=UPI00203BF1FE|nr:efflux RND transporter periplasmic adaptor subunit [Paenibacillus pasadenensis]MCM3747034.1 efflux RND transporter periplasmic adaptor subunit [Paenibacillus pasadenensis]
MEAAVLTEERSSGKSKKKKTGGIIIAFILMMIVLTLFSNTILEYSLPRVSAERPSFGGLSFKVNGTGTVESAEEVKVLAEYGAWPVEEVEVEVGDKVKKGQALIRFDTSAAEEQIEAEQLNYEKQQIALEKLQTSYKEAKQVFDDKLAAGFRRDMESAQLDLDAQKRKIDRLREEISKYSVLTSSEEGTVTEVLAAVGATVAPGSAVVNLKKTSTSFEFKADVTNEQAKRLKAGDSIKITVPSLDDAVFEVKIKSVGTKKPDKQEGQQNNPGGGQQENTDQKEIIAVLKDKRLQGGETGDFEWSKKAGSEQEPEILVPNSAIRESNEDGKFVYVVSEKEGSLGKEYYIRKVKLTVKESDAEYTEVKDGISPADFVVTSSNKAIEEGKRVLVTDEEENGSE